MGRERLTPGLAFLGAGFGLLAVTAAIEAYLVLGGAATQGLMDQDLIRLALVPWALGLVFFGHALDHPEVLWDKARGRRVFATYLLFADGAIHLLAIGEHVDLPVVAFFAVLAPLQLVSAWFLLKGSPGFLGGWLIASIGLIGLYAATRFLPLPFLDAQYRVEPLGIVSKALEILLVAALAQELRVAARLRRGTGTGRPAA